MKATSHLKSAVTHGKVLLCSMRSSSQRDMNQHTYNNLRSTIIPWVRGAIRYPSLARVFLLVPLLFACFTLSQTARAANPAPDTLAISASDGASDGVQNFSNTALLRPAPTIITFDAPGAGTGPGQGTLAFSINPARAITGFYLDSGDVFHGYVRARNGTITTLKAPGSGTGAGQGTHGLS